MNILAVIHDEIIRILFEKKYIPLLKDIHFEFQDLEKVDHERIKAGKYDLIICDLDDSFEQVLHLYNAYRDQTLFLFITDWEYTRYLELLKENKISNIYPKGLLLEDYLTSMKLLGNLCQRNIFGIQNYTDNPLHIDNLLVHFSGEIRNLSFQLGTFFPGLSKEKTMKLKLAFSEIASNAFFHSHGIEKGKDKSIKEPILISFAEDEEKLLFSVSDRQGTLTKDTVLFWILKRFQEDEDLPLDHGRGFFLMKNIIDNLIINIKQNESTEFIAIFYKSEYMGEKSLIIHQL